MIFFPLVNVQIREARDINNLRLVRSIFYYSFRSMNLPCKAADKGNSKQIPLLTASSIYRLKRKQKACIQLSCLI